LFYTTSSIEEAVPHPKQPPPPNTHCQQQHPAAALCKAQAADACVAVIGLSLPPLSAVHHSTTAVYNSNRQLCVLALGADMGRTGARSACCYRCC
jgi:hypothetical protein